MTGGYGGGGGRLTLYGGGNLTLYGGGSPNPYAQGGGGQVAPSNPTSSALAATATGPEAVKRIRAQAGPGEVESGTAQNVLLSDLAKHPDPHRQAAAGGVFLDEAVLRRINVTTATARNLGVLRNGGRITWPAALVGLGPDEDRTEIGNLAKRIYERAAEGKPDATQIHKLQVRLRRLQGALAAKVNEMPVNKFLDAGHFLENLRGAVRALETGAVPLYDAWTRWTRDGRTVQQVAEYLKRRGLLIAPATPGDESAYLALYNALASYDVALSP